MPEERHWAALEAVASLGPDVAIQHRDPGAPVRPFLERARRLATMCEETGAQLCINDRLDVALVVGANLHLPVDAPRPREVRAQLPAGSWLSAAVHSAEELADAAGADCLLVSPVYSPGSKLTDSRPPLGPEGFRRLAALAGVPALALGGIDVVSLPTLVPVAGVAVQSAVLGADDPERVARSLLMALGTTG
jgi:thiamine-phosphate pyrophosphorylase